MTRPPFPAVLDSTIIAAFRSCPRKMYLEFVEHWKPRDASVHLHAGAAYAAGLERARKAFYENGAPDSSAIPFGIRATMEHYGDFECPPDSAKSLERTVGAIEYYFERYPLASDPAVPIDLPGGRKGIEFGFVEPLDETHPETGDPLLYSGRMDMIVSFEGMTLGLDDKTTSQLGASWPRQWDLRSQFTGYSWGAGRQGVKMDGWLVRGVSILKTKYDTLQAITYRPQWQIDRWYTQLLRDIRRMKQCWAEGYWDYNLDHACTEYGGCIFRDVCLMKPEQVQPLLDMRFQRRSWNPVTREETVL